MLGRSAIRPVAVRRAAGERNRTGYQLEPIIAQGSSVHFPVKDHGRQRPIKGDQVWPDLNRAVSMSKTQSALRYQHPRRGQKRPDRIGFVEQIGRASCRERVEITVVAVSLKTKR